MATPEQQQYYADLAWAYPFGAVQDPNWIKELDVRAASKAIDARKQYAKKAWPWKPGSLQSKVAEQAYQMQIERGRSSFERKDFDALEARLLPHLQTSKLTFTRNTTNGRQPVSYPDAIREARRYMSMVRERVTARLQSTAPQPQQQPKHDPATCPLCNPSSTPASLQQMIDHANEQQGSSAQAQSLKPLAATLTDYQPLTDTPMSDEQIEEVADELMGVSEPKAKAPAADTWDALYARIEALRAFARSREGMESLDSMRVALDARKAFDAGVPSDAIISSIIADWSDETVSQAGERRFDYASFGEAPEGVHAVGPIVERLIAANVPTYLHGPAGTGKSSAARKASELLNLPYFELNLAGAMASAIRGRDTMTGFIESQFTQAYRDGGILVLEEIDAAHPNVLTAINNAVANGHWANEATGAIIERHPDFRIVATANTLGTGATKSFTGRNRLDGATLDRFRVGRVKVDHDPKLERYLVGC